MITTLASPPSRIQRTLIAGIACLISCGGHQLPDPDASVEGAPAARKAPGTAGGCDCPATEPPIVAGRWFFQSGTLNADPDEDEMSATALCPWDYLVVSGGCSFQDPVPIPNVILREAGIIPGQGWRCTAKNSSTGRVYYKISVLCLSLAP